MARIEVSVNKNVWDNANLAKEKLEMMSNIISELREMGFSIKCNVSDGTFFDMNKIIEYKSVED